MLWLLATLVLGLAFLGMEAHDFVTMFADGATPDRSGFLSAFFVLVRTHGLHVTAGCVWIVVMLLQIGGLRARRPVKVNLLRLGLFWHFLDVIWIAIFSVVYLQGADPMTSPRIEQRETMTYVVGYGSALVLTGCRLRPGLLPPAGGPDAFYTVLGLGLVQMLVHFRCFLHIDLKRSARADLQLILFSSLVVALMVGGTLVVLFNLHHRMM